MSVLNGKPANPLPTWQNWHAIHSNRGPVTENELDEYWDLQIIYWITMKIQEAASYTTRRTSPVASANLRCCDSTDATAVPFTFRSLTPTSTYITGGSKKNITGFGHIYTSASELSKLSPPFPPLSPYALGFKIGARISPFWRNFSDPQHHADSCRCHISA